MRLISPLVSNTTIPILKSRMWAIEGEIHWNRNIQSRVLTPPINKSNIFIQKVDDKQLIRQKKKKNQSRSERSGIWLIRNWYLAELEGELYCWRWQKPGLSYILTQLTYRFLNFLLSPSSVPSLFNGLSGYGFAKCFWTFYILSLVKQ